jgi:hypothetical protein
MRTRTWLSLTIVLVTACPRKVPKGEISPEGWVALSKLAAEARAARDSDDFASCGERYSRASRMWPGRGTTAYSAACCLALAGKQGAAVAELQRAIDLGYHDGEQLAEDEDLTTLHQLPGWAKLVQSARKQHERYLAENNAELYRIFNEDQDDRKHYPGRDALKKNDDRRYARVRQILDSGAAKTGDDYYYAAMIFQHGDSVADYQLANRLARRSVELENPMARWLVAATKDRELMTLGKPQLYGTQYVSDDKGRMVLYEVDPSVTDEERAKWFVPSLAEARKRAEERNARRRR